MTAREFGMGKISVEEEKLMRISERRQYVMFMGRPITKEQVDQWTMADRDFISFTTAYTRGSPRYKTFCSVVVACRMTNILMCLKCGGLYYGGPEAQYHRRRCNEPLLLCELEGFH